VLTFTSYFCLFGRSILLFLVFAAFRRIGVFILFSITYLLLFIPACFIVGVCNVFVLFRFIFILSALGFTGLFSLYIALLLFPSLLSQLFFCSVSCFEIGNLLFGFFSQIRDK